MYIKIQTTGGGSSGGGLSYFMVYDKLNQLIPLTKADVVETNASQRTSDAAYLNLFQKVGTSAQPYGGQGLYYTIKLPNDVKEFSKIYVMNWANTTASVSSIYVYISKDNYKYEEIYTGLLGVNEQQDILQGYKYIEKSFLLKSNKKTYSLQLNSTIYETKMTSNTAPLPLTASASSVYSTTYPAWRAFDGIYNINGSTATAWVSANGTTSGDITLDFGINTKVSNVSIAPRNFITDGIYNAPKNFIVQGSYDGILYTDLREFTNQTNWTLGRLTKFDLQKAFNYRYYRIKINAITGGGTVTYIAIGQIIYSYDENTLLSLPSIDVKNFIKYGNAELVSLGRNMNSKNYILQDTVSENEQGLWTTQLDRKPLSIKFD